MARTFARQELFSAQRKLGKTRIEIDGGKIEFSAVRDDAGGVAGAGRRLWLTKYRATQIFEALYKGRVESLAEITTLPIEVRERLAAEGYVVGRPQIAQTATSVDGTERYLMRMGDGETVETVWMPEGDGGERRRWERGCC